MNILFAITGIAFALFVAFLFSFDRKKIDFKKTLIMIFIQVLIVLLIRVDLKVCQTLADGIYI